MKTTIYTLGLLLGVLALAPAAQAQGCNPIIIQAPSPYCWYQQDCYGRWYGPNYCYTPPYPPFQGMVFPPPRPAAPGGMPAMPGMMAMPGRAPVPIMPGQNPTVAFPSHQWARSPRDFFMVD